MIVTLTGSAHSTVSSGDIRAHFPIYSITKSVIGLAFVRLADECLLSLDDPIHYWIEDERFPDITIRQLLTHTSGIPDYARLTSYHDAVRHQPSNAWSDEDILDRALALGFDFAPGEGWAYSNTGYLLLRMILDRFGGIEPTLHALGLNSTFIATNLVDFSAAVPAKSSMFDGDVRGIYDPRWVGHRTLVSNCFDIHRFLLTLVTTSVSDPNTFVDIGQTAPGFVQASYGLGVMADPKSPLGVVVGHGGHGPGYVAAGFAVVDDGKTPIAAVALSNQEATTPRIEQIALELLQDSIDALGT